MVTRRKYLSTVAFTAASLAHAGCIGEDENGGVDARVEWNHRVYDRVRFPSQSEGEFFETDDESKYVGVQLALTCLREHGGVFVTQKISTEQYSEGPEPTFMADGSSALIHPRSQTSALREVDGGETVEATLLYVCPPDSSNYSLEVVYYHENTYEIIRNEDLEIDLISVPESG